MHSHYDLAREIYRLNLNGGFYQWDDLKPTKKAQYLFIAEETVSTLNEVLGEAAAIQVIEVTQKMLKGGCGCK